MRRRPQLSLAALLATVSVLAAAPPVLAAPAPAPAPGRLPAGVIAAPDAAPPAKAGGGVEYADDHVLVRPRKPSGSAATDGLLARFGVRAAAAAVGTSGWYALPTGDTPAEDLVRELAADPAVAAVERDVVRRAAERPDDYWYVTPYQDEQGVKHLQRTELAVSRVEEAWDLSHGSSGVVVAVLDTGVLAGHEDLKGKLAPGYDAVNRDNVPDDDDPFGHGTATAGLVGASTGNGDGIASVGRNTTVMPVKVLDADGLGTDANLVTGINYALYHKADVISMSLGGYGTTTVLRDAIARAVAADVVVVASAGNSHGGDYSYPASFPGVISVGATDHAGRLTYFSTWNDRVTLAAPGWDMTSLSALVDAEGNADYVQGGLNGTSFSAPLVAGAAALLRARFPGDTAAKVRDRLTAAARDAGPPGVDPYYGHGVLDVAAALGAPRARALAVTRTDTSDAADLPAATGSGTCSEIGAEGDADWCAVSVAAGHTLDVRVTAAGDEGPQVVDPVVEVYDAQRRLLAVVDEGLPGQEESLSVPVAAAGTHYVVVRSYNGSGRPGLGYELTTSTAPTTLPALTPVEHLQVSAAVPAAHATGVRRDGAVRVDFTAPLDPTTAVAATTVQLLDGRTGAAVGARRAYDATTRRVTLTPSAALVPNRAYVVVVAGATSADGQRTTAPYRWSFVTATPGGLRFTPVSPVRVMDTRSGKGVRAGTVGGGDVVDLQVTGVAGVPSSARSVVLNVTAVGGPGAATVQVYPTPSSSTEAPPTVSSQNLVAGETAANLVTVQVGAGGRVRLRVVGAGTQLLADLAGYYATTGPVGFTPLAPQRLLDTRSGVGAPQAAVGPRGSVDLLVAGRGGVPADATAVVLNLTGVRPTVSTYVSAIPTPLRGTPVPQVSALNLAAGDTRANLVVVPLGRDGRARLVNNAGSVHLLGDLAGYYAPEGRYGFAPVAPVRVLDSRSGLGVPQGKLAAGASVDLATAPPSGASAAVLNVTAVQPAGPAYLTVWPTPAGTAATPQVSTVNLPAARIRPNAATVVLGAGPALRFTPSSTMDVVTDLAGWFVP